MLPGRCHFPTPASVGRASFGIELHPALKEHGPYLVVLVELPHAGGIRMLGNLLGDPRQVVTIGAPVEAVFEPHDDAKPPFTLVAEARRAARASRSAVLRGIEGNQTYDAQQELLAVASRVAREGRLSRFVCVSKKLS